MIVGLDTEIHLCNIINSSSRIIIIFISFFKSYYYL